MRLLARFPWLLLSLASPAAGDLVPVPAGDFVMGSDFGEEDERPAHPVELPAFRVDQHEVTVAEYRRCVAARRCAPPAGPVDRTGSDEEPVVWVRWIDADAYCRFVGRRLPTEAEWEKAARGPSGRRFPWGDEVDCARANFGDYRGEGRCPQHPGRPMAVGRFPSGASPYGALDMAGNVWEWVADWYDPAYYARSPRRAPPGPKAGTRRVLRGGACCSMLGLPRSANRLAFPPDYRDDDIGFRCAADAAR